MESLHHGERWFNFLKEGDGLCNVYGHAKFPQYIKQDFLREAQIPHRIETRWAHISLVNATLNLLKEAYQDPRNEYFILASEKCIPLYTFKESYEYITKTDKSFVFHYRWNSRPGQAKKRWNQFNNFEKFNLNHSSLKLNIPQNQFLKQSQWMLLRRDHVQFLITNLYTQAFKFISAPDEHYFINVLNQRCPKFHNNNVNYPLTYVDWKGGNRAHPKQFSDVKINNIKKLHAYSGFRDRPRRQVDGQHLFMRKVWYGAKIK